MTAVVVRDEKAQRVTLTRWPQRTEHARPIGTARRSAILTEADGSSALRVSHWADATDEEPPTHGADWQVALTPYRSFLVDESLPAGCLVVVRQPLCEPDLAVARDWADHVLAALEADASSPEGLRAATFLVAEDGSHVVNLAEWTEPDAHRAALRPADFGQGRSLGESEHWRATREHPGITPGHDVRRYVPCRPEGGSPA